MQVPLSQRRHTNIAVVRYTKNGVKLEIACYKNKVISYRSGVEKRMDEVLQVDRIFTNVGRGFVASEKDIQAVFGKDMTEEQAIKFMLEHGELQVAQQERTAEIDELFKDISVIISQKCVNQVTQRPFPTQVIEQSLRSIGAAVKLDQPVKKQALALIHQLIDSQIIPIARAKMKVRCTTTVDEALDIVVQWCAENGAEVVERSLRSEATETINAAEAPSHDISDAPRRADEATGSVGKPASVLVLLPPHLFRNMEIFVKTDLPPGSALHMVDTAVMEAGDGILSDHAAMSAAAAVPETSAPRRIDPTAGIATAARAGSSHPRSVHTLNTSHDDDDDDDEGRGGRGKKKKKKAGKKGRPEDAEENRDLPDGPHHRPNKAGAPAIGLALGGLQSGDDDDDESDGGRRGKKAKKPKRKKDPAVTGSGKGKAGPPTTQEEEEEDSDAEVEGNRRQRKKMNTKRVEVHNDDFDEEDFDYGDEEYGEE